MGDAQMADASGSQQPGLKESSRLFPDQGIATATEHLLEACLAHGGMVPKQAQQLHHLGFVGFQVVDHAVLL